MELTSTLRIQVVSYTIFVIIFIYPSIYIHLYLCIIPITILTTIKYIINSICLYLGMTSLMYAAMWDKTDTVRILSDHGADLNAKDNNGKLINIIVTIYLSISIYLSMCL